MSIKNNIDMVREELTSEEKFFEKSVITERFIKKYKALIITGGLVVVLAIVGNIAYSLQEEATVKSVNAALATLETNTKNIQALEELKVNSPKLYDVFLYSQAIKNNDIEAMKKLQSSKDPLINNLANYETATTLNTLQSYTLNQDSVYKDLAQVQTAILLLKEGNTLKAHEKLRLISENSAMSKIAKTLLHYGVK